MKDTKRTSESFQNSSIHKRFTHSVSSNDFTGSHLANGPIIESENMDRHGFSDEFETRDRSSLQPIGSQQEPQTTLSGRISQKPLHYREVLVVKPLRRRK